MRMRFKRPTPVLVFALIFAATASARKPGDPIKPGWNLFSKQQDMQIGMQSAAQVRLKYAEVRNPFLEDYIRKIGERLASTPEAQQSGFRFTFTLLNVQQVNAFALPGGPMFIFTGLLKATENEAQLAGVMAHEMSHVILRHGTHEASKAKSVNLLTQLAGAVAGGNASAAGQLANLGLGLGANSFILHFSREAETEADLLGSHLMAESGYNPIEMARFFEALNSMTDQGPQFLSDHPSPGNREKAIETEIRGLPQREYGFEFGQFQRAKTEIGYLRPGEPGSNSVVSSLPTPAPPPREWRMLNGSLFAVAFPANWSVYGQSSPLTIAPPDGLQKAANGAVLMSSGVTMDYFDPGPNMSLGTGTLKLIAYLHERDPNLQWQSTQQQKSVRVGQSDGLVTALHGTSPSGAPEADVLVTVSRPQGLFWALFASPQQSFPQFQRAFEQMISSIRFNQ
jgi:peptidase M48-like protein